MHRSRGVSGEGSRLPPGKFKFIKVSKIGLEHLTPPPPLLPASPRIKIIPLTPPP